MAKKKKKELNPIIKENKDNIQNVDLKSIAKQLQDSMVIDKAGNESNDSFYKNVLNQLFDEKNIELKTEYLNVQENFSGAKLTFLSRFGNMPYLEQFIHIFEKKRVSLERKGRQEIIMALAEREKEVQREGQANLRNLFGV